jgi:hypothetical protein
MNVELELAVRAALLFAECELHGMIAENKQRELRNESMAYTGQSFEDLVLETATTINDLKP